MSVYTLRMYYTDNVNDDVNALSLSLSLLRSLSPSLSVQTGARVTILGTTPAHNTATAADDVTVVALNKAAAALAAENKLPYVPALYNIYTIST